MIVPVALHIIFGVAHYSLLTLSLHYTHTETQFGILPTLEFDGKRLSGNGPIARYLAEKYGEKSSSIVDSFAYCTYATAVL